MTVAECRALIEDYVRWLKEAVHVEELEGCLLIKTPFLDRHNDAIEIYIEPRNGGLRLTDDGYTMQDLRASGMEFSTEKRKSYLTAILHGFGVRVEDNEIVVTATRDDFPQKKHNLVQAILAINDMFVMGEEQVLSVFKEDVARYLELQSVPHIMDFKLSGKSGFDHKFDFGLPKTPRHPQRLLQAINYLTREQASSLAFAVSDVKAVRPEPIEAYAFLNDETRALNEEYVAALKAYEIAPIRWSQRDSLVSTLNGSARALT
jgi:hypothetical protein